MGVVFALVFMLVLLCLGFVAFLIGVIGLIVVCVLRKKRKISGKLLLVLFSLILTFGVLVLAIPGIFFGIIYAMNTFPPPDYVETDIVIEEDGYQSERFTADGVVYTVLPFEINFQNREQLEPVFSYKTSGFLNGSQCGNYYRVPNEHGFTMVCSRYGSLFAPQAEYETVRHYYEYESGELWRLEWAFGGETDANAAQARVLHDYAQLGRDTWDDTFLLPAAACCTVIANRYSEDTLIFYESYWLVLSDGKVYCERGTTKEEETDEFFYVVAEIPEPLQTQLFSALSGERIGSPATVPARVWGNPCSVFA